MSNYILRPTFNNDEFFRKFQFLFSKPKQLLQNITGMYRQRRIGLVNVKQSALFIINQMCWAGIDKALVQL